MILVASVIVNLGVGAFGSGINLSQAKTVSIPPIFLKFSNMAFS
jgi:hypothetical protein